MMSDTNGLRFRGKQTDTINTSSTNTSSTNTTTTKTIKFNDAIQYNKINNDVKIDLITPKFNLNDSAIGWKLCKSADGEDRIVKLFIPAESNKVLPISDDFFDTNFKERSDYAIVMDIQKADLFDEISVVPDEKIAYNHIYTNSIISYEVGKEIKPDGFSSDQSVSCSQGIHYFRNRKAVFKTYVPGYEFIEI
jgi:hypothetical protein